MLLTEDTFTLFAAKAYTNNSCQSLDEFHADLSNIVHLKKILTKYNTTGELKTRLAQNHLISIFNCFTTIPAIQILFFKISPKNHSTLKTLLKYLDRCPEFLKLYDNLDIKDIAIDEALWEKLSKNSE